MEEQNNIPSSSQTSIKKIIISIIFEIFFITITLAAFFGILNYFNILRIYQILPTFSFLPHIPSSISTQNESVFIPSPTPTIMPITFTPEVLKNASVLSYNFLTSTLQSSLLPYELFNTKNVFLLQSNKDNNSAYASWSIKTDRQQNFYLTVYYAPPSRISSIFLEIIDPKMLPTSINSVQITNMYLRSKDFGPTLCNSNNPQVCSAFTKEKQGSYGYLYFNDPKTKNSVFITCYIPTTSPIYITATMCQKR